MDSFEKNDFRKGFHDGLEGVIQSSFKRSYLDGYKAGLEIRNEERIPYPVGVEFIGYSDSDQLD